MAGRESGVAVVESQSRAEIKAERASPERASANVKVDECSRRRRRRRRRRRMI